MKNRLSKKHIKRVTAILLTLVFVSIVMLPVAVIAENSEKTVRVGWYESPFNKTDDLGRKSGYAYEYQQKIAAYTNWEFEYVEGSWPELMDKLRAGELDLMSDVSYTPERTKEMLFSSLPMGTEEYYIFVTPDNTQIKQDDYSSVNGKKIGVNKSSIQLDLFRDWEAVHGIEAEIVELVTDNEESLHMLKNGDIDAYITLDYYNDLNIVVPVFKIGSSDFFFAVKKDRQDILAELDIAMNKIQDENIYYNQQLFEKHVKMSAANLYLNNEESEWLANHGAIRVGYQDNYLAFCAADKKTGKLTGALKDYLKYASHSLKNASIVFDSVAYPTAADAMDALKNGEIDCMFPANFSEYDGETMGIIMTPSLMRTEMYAVVRSSDQQEFSNKEHIIVAVNEGNPNYNIFLKDNFPGWQPAYFTDTPECLRAVRDGEADCVLISNYRFNNIAELCEKYRLVTLTTGVNMDYAFAIERNNKELYSILAKISNVVPDSATHASLSYYFTEDAKKNFTDFIIENLVLFLTMIFAVILLILTLLIRSLRAEKKANEEHRLISATETDSLTGLYNRNFFFEYANRMYEENPDKPMDAIVLNIDRFHSVNSINGRDFGDQVLSALGNEIRAALEETEGIAGRFEADSFDIYCLHTDNYAALFDRLQNMLYAFNLKASIRLRMGVMPWQEGLEPAVMFDRASTACSMAREHYKNRLVVFDERVSERENYEQQLMNDLWRALESGEFEVYYQAQYAIQGEKPELVGAEALVRWNHPEFGLVMPSDFISLFEKNGQISMVDKYVWKEVTRQIADWRKRYGVLLPVSVNLSRMDIFDSSLESTLDTLLLEKGLDRHAINLEITESAYTSNEEKLIRVLEELKGNGYNIEMDDFGAGYSSLSMLSNMPVDRIKMDSAFIRNIESDEKYVRMVELVLNIAKNLKATVVAEGVETEQQLKMLKEMGCSIVQGYYFSRPAPAAEFEKNIIEKNIK